MMEPKITPPGALTAGLLAALGASICCVGSLFVWLGLSQAWIARLAALAPLRPFWLAATAVFFGLAFWQLHRHRPSEPCKEAVVKRRQRAIFWILGAIALALVAFPWYGPVLL